MCLDKDILYKNNTIYSKDTCIFIPERINILFTKNNALWLGVTVEQADELRPRQELATTGYAANAMKSIADGA